MAYIGKTRATRAILAKLEGIELDLNRIIQNLESPEARKPREWWIGSNASNGPWCVFETKDIAMKYPWGNAVHVREVIEEC